MSIEQGWPLAEELLYRALKWELAGRPPKDRRLRPLLIIPGRRGLHVRREDDGAKLVRCSYGAIFDVILDIWPASSTYRNSENFATAGWRRWTGTTTYSPRDVPSGKGNTLMRINAHQ